MPSKFLSSQYSPACIQYHSASPRHPQALSLIPLPRGHRQIPGASHMRSTPGSPGQGGLPCQPLTLSDSQRRQGGAGRHPALGMSVGACLAGVPTTIAGLCSGAAMAPPRLLRQQPKTLAQPALSPQPPFKQGIPLSHSLLGKVVPPSSLVGRHLSAPLAWLVKAPPNP